MDFSAELKERQKYRNLLSKEEKQYIKVKTFKKNDVLHHEGDKCNEISIVVSGQVKITSLSFEDSELVYNTIRKNEIFGNNLLFSDSPYYKGDVLCTQESVIVTILKNDLLHILQSNKFFLCEYLNVQSNFSKKLNSTIKLLSFQSAEERFKFYLFQFF